MSNAVIEQVQALQSTSFSTASPTPSLATYPPATPYPQIPGLRPALSTRTETRPAIRYVVDGLLRHGAFSVLAGKPKQGKSSLSRFIGSCVAKGIPCLGRETERGEVLLVSTEDASDHVDDHLSILGYDEATDAPIHVLDLLPVKVQDSLRLLDDILLQFPGISFVAIDTLQKFLRVSDLNDFVEVQGAVRQLRDIAVSRGIHILALTHAKKANTDNVFDQLLGSTAIRAETDTTLAIYECGGQRVFAAEVRRGRQIEPTVIHATIVSSPLDGAELVGSFTLQGSLDAWKESQSAKVERRAKATYEERVLSFLQQQDGHTALHQTILEEVTGSTAGLSEAIANLESRGVLGFSGVKRSPVNPLRLTLNSDSPVQGGGLQMLQHIVQKEVQ